MPALKPSNKIAFVLTGLAASGSIDLFHRALRTHWALLMVLFVLAYLVICGFFALLYALDPEGLDNCLDHYETPSDVFFFSVQTLSTIGYGYLAPRSTWCHIVNFFESFTGLVFTAVCTGGIFSRLSRPTARIAFAQSAVMQTIDGKRCISFRIANQRRTPVLNLKVTLSVLKKRVDASGEFSVAFLPLELDVSVVPLFVGGVRVRHVVDERSPLAGFKSDEDATKLGIASFQLIVQGMEENYGHVVSARRIYAPADVLVGYRFLPLLTENKTQLTVDLGRLDMVEKEEEVRLIGRGVTR